MTNRIIVIDLNYGYARRRDVGEKSIGHLKELQRDVVTFSEPDRGRIFQHRRDVGDRKAFIINHTQSNIAKRRLNDGQFSI